MLVLDAAFGAVAGSGGGRLWVFRVGAAKLEHEALDDAVKVQTIVEAARSQLHEVASRLWHLVGVKLDGNVTERGL